MPDPLRMRFGPTSGGMTLLPPAQAPIPAYNPYNPYAGGGRYIPEGYQVQPAMMDMLQRYLALIRNMPSLQSWMGQQSGMMRDILGGQAQSASANIGGQLASRGMMRSGAFPAALQGIQQQQMQSMSQILPQILQQYFARQQALMGGAMQAAGGMFVPEEQEQPSGAWQGLGYLSGQGVTSLLPLLFSDRRLKTGIIKIGELENGLSVYSYQYIWDSEYMRRIGVMADEVERIRPEAVIDIGGYKAVNYARL